MQITQNAKHYLLLNPSSQHRQKQVSSPLKHRRNRPRKGSGLGPRRPQRGKRLAARSQARAPEQAVAAKTTAEASVAVPAAAAAAATTADGVRGGDCEGSLGGALQQAYLECPMLGFA